MRKIYNEIVIDMNPDSSSFEEVIFEDSFEHYGDIMLMQDDDDDEIQYVDTDKLWTSAHNYGWDGNDWVVTHENTHSGDHTNRPSAETVTEEGVTYYSHPIFTTPGSAEVWKWEWKTTPPNMVGTGDMAKNVVEGAGALDEYAYGDIQDIYGLLQGEEVDYETVVDQFMTQLGITGQDISRDTLIAELKNMPKMELDKVKKEAATQRKEADIYGIQRKLGAGREQVAGAAGKSGVRSPSAGGFKGMEDITKGAYEQTAETQRGYEADIYGLEQDVETKFSNWLEGILV